MNFKCAFAVQQHIQTHFPGVCISTEVPTRLRWVKKGKRVVKQFLPITEEEQRQIAPLIAEFRRLYYQPVDNAPCDEEIFGERMI